MAKIYTKVGDKGSTSLLGGQKVTKDDARLSAYGTTDELNSFLGWARAALDEAVKNVSVSSLSASSLDSLTKLSADLETLQNWLFDVGSLLAALPEDRAKFSLATVSAEHVRWLEERIDGATAVMKPLRNFILPAGSEPSTRLHIARTVARRAERLVVVLKADLPESTIPFMNRLSDYLFVMARFCNYLMSVEDVLWKKQ